MTARTPPLRRNSALVAFSAVVVAACWLSAAIPGWRIAPDLGHSWIIPLLVAFLCWERWPERPPLRATAVPRPTWLLLLIVGPAGFALRLLLTPYPLWPSVLLLFLALVVGTTLVGAWLLAGRAGVRWLGPLLVLLVGGLPIPSAVETSLILPLREGMASIVAELCNALGHPAAASGTSIRLAQSWVGIDEACGGIRSLQACALFGLFFGEWFRFTWRRRAMLVGLALVAALLGNFTRVVFLAFHAANGHSAGGKAHDIAGWVAMVGSLVATALIAARWNGFRLPQPAPRQPRRTVNSPAWKWIVAAALLLAINDVVARLWFAHGQQRDEHVPQWTAALPESQWSFKSDPLSATAAEMLRPDRFHAGHWLLKDGAEADAYFVEWTHGQIARSVPFLHNPAICLPYAGCELTATLPSIDVQWRDGSIPFFVYQFRRTGQPLLVAFTIWDPSRGTLLQRPAPTHSWTQWLTHRWADVADAREHQPAQLLALSLAGTAESVPQLRAVLQTLVVPAP